jgi:hypothetical protein
VKIVDYFKKTRKGANYSLVQTNQRDEILDNKMKRTEVEKINREDVTYVLLLEVLDGTIIQISSAGARNDLRK